MDQLERETWLDAGSVLLRPATQEVPGSQAQMFGDEQPQANEVAGNAIGEGLSDTLLDSGGVGRAVAALGLGGIGLNGAGDTRGKLKEFFFADRIRRPRVRHCEH